MKTAAPTAQTPEAILTLFAQTLNRGDLESLLTLYEENARLIPEPHRTPVHGKAAIRGALQNFLALNPRIEVLDTAVVQADDLALLRSAWRLTGTGPDGQTVQMAHESTDVVRRGSDGTWRIVIDHPFGADPA